MQPTFEVRFHDEGQQTVWMSDTS